MLLLIDNYDSFTYNLAQYFGELGCELVVRRNDAISLREIDALAPERICISPGPCTPREAGISKEVILAFGARTPILGVCLGHQCIAEAYGGEIVRASRLMHGKASTITHNGNSLFADLATPFEAGRYHSLVVTVTVSHGGVDRMRMSGRSLKGDRFIIHPEIPFIAKFFVDVPDTKIWLTNPAPAGFLRWEGPIVLPTDPMIRVDLISGEKSGPAESAGS